MVSELNVDPIALHHGSNNMFYAVGEAASDFISFEDGLANAAPGWIGSSHSVLGELAARWETMHSHHKSRVGGLGSHVADAVVSYLTNEDGSAQVLGFVSG